MKYVAIIAVSLLTGCLEDEQEGTNNNAASNLAEGLTLENGTFLPTPTPTPDPNPDTTPSVETFDGVSFTTQEVTKALDIANNANETQLSEGGVTTAARNTIINNRPWSQFSLVAATSGIGPATIQAIKDMTEAWTISTLPPEPEPEPEANPEP